MSGRIRNEAMRSKVMSAHDAAALVQNGWNIGFSGFTGAGYPKEFPEALAAVIDAHHNKGEEFRIGVAGGVDTAFDIASDHRIDDSAHLHDHHRAGR